MTGLNAGPSPNAPWVTNTPWGPSAPWVTNAPWGPNDVRGFVDEAPERVEFDGVGREYFRIWAVDFALSVITLGLYSPWAKVRRLQYFYRHTRLAGATFDYRGKPLTILKQRLRLAICVVASGELCYLAPDYRWHVGLGLLCLVPWFFVRALKHRLANTSYRGARFRFEGTSLGLLWPLAIGPLLTVFAFYIFYPSWALKVSRYVYDRVTFGRERFSFHADPGSFQSAIVAAEIGLGLIYMVGVFLGFYVVPKVGASASPGQDLLFASSAALGGLGLVAALIAIVAGLRASLQQLVWSTLQLGPHRFSCDLRCGQAVGLALKNAALGLLTLGLYPPFAAVASAKLRLESVCLLPGASLEELVPPRAPPPP